MKNIVYIIIGIVLFILMIVIDAIVFPSMDTSIYFDVVPTDVLTEKSYAMLIMIILYLISFTFMAVIKKPRKIKYLITTIGVFVLNNIFIIISFM